MSVMQRAAAEVRAFARAKGVEAMLESIDDATIVRYLTRYLNAVKPVDIATAAGLYLDVEVTEAEIEELMDRIISFF